MLKLLYSQVGSQSDSISLRIVSVCDLKSCGAIQMQAKSYATICSSSCLSQNQLDIV